MAGTHEVRLHRDQIDFGNLECMIGTWHSDIGFNLIAVPDQEGSFTLLIAPIRETLVIEAIPATTPNRGLTKIQNIPTLRYNTTVSDARTGELMHVECGFWELPEPDLNDGFDVFRLASIPHGNAVEAMGNTSVASGPPDIDMTLSGLPSGIIPPSILGYAERYRVPADAPFDPVKPNKTLTDYLAAQEAQGFKVTKTVTVEVSTANKGGIANIASIDSNTPTPSMDSTFWIETLEGPDGQTYQQLQYSQRVMIDFPVKQNKPGDTIKWPHITVNTLKLVK
jgi:hypothetical protein